MKNIERSARRRAARAFTLLLPLLALAWAAPEARAQWTQDSATNIRTTNNVELGPGPTQGQSPPTEKLVNAGGAVFGGARARTELWPGFTSNQNPALFELNSGADVTGGSRFSALSLVTTQRGLSDVVGSIYFSNGASARSDKRLSFLYTQTDGATDAGAMVFGTAGGGSLAERMRITSAGRVGVGTDSPAFALDVRGGRINASDGLCIGGVCKGSWAEVGGGAGQWTGGAGGSGPISYGGGNVGVGTASPRTAQEISYASGGSLPGGVNYIGQTIQRSDAQSDAWGAGLALLAYQNRGAFLTAGGYGFAVSTYDGAAATERLRVNPTGLSVTGAVNATGAITGATVSATYQDVAEWVPSVQKLSAGTVVVLDTRHSNHVLASTTAYDTRVAGVVSARPGIALGEGGEGKALVATTGRVKVKVDATRAPVCIGDLLVTSGVEGVAMRSEPVSIGGRQFHAPGTIIGKALEPLEKGAGEILVLLSLQ